MGPLRIGVLGTADIARRRLLPAMAASADVDPVAVASRDLGRARETARPFGCRAIAGYRRLIADPEVQAVYVPVPPALHAEWVEAALHAGKHVLAEKPLTTDRTRTEGLLALARERGLVLMENVMFVHHPQHVEVLGLIARGAIGELRALRTEFTIPRRPARDIRHRAELGGGALWDTGVYPVRAGLHLLGPRLEIVAAALTSSDGDHVDTSGAALARTPDGVLVQLAFGLDHGYRSGYEVCGSEGRIVVDRAFTPPAAHRPVIRVEQGTTVREVVLPAADQVALTLTAFARAVAGAGDEQAGMTLRQAALLDDIRRSSAAGTRGQVPPADPGR
ncbi:Gfo/Idh/MocA family protein [Actinoplanes sp. NPDC004185]